MLAGIARGIKWFCRGGPAAAESAGPALEGGIEGNVIRRAWLLAVLAVCGARAATAGESAAVEARALPDRPAVEVRLAPAAGVRLYRSRVRVELAGPHEGLALGGFELPPAHRKAFDEAEGGEVEYYTAPVAFAVPVLGSAGPGGGRASLVLRVGFQGCTEDTCFPPTWREFRLEIAFPASAAPLPLPPVAPQPPSVQPAPQPEPEPEEPEEERNPLLVILLAFLAGLGICYTPCIYPMIPVTVAVIGGIAGGRPGEKPARLRLVAYTLTYVLGIAASYAVLGVIAARAGKALGPLLQHPAVLAALAAAMTALALSMFGAFDLVLPAGLTGRLGALSGGGSLPALLLSGLVLGLAASPCVSAPLGGLLISIGRTGNWMVGGAALFAFAWGMSALLIVAGIFPGLLARPGPWMLHVKAGFGVILAAMALYFARSLMPAALFGWTAAGLCLVAGAGLVAAGYRLTGGGRPRGLVHGLAAMLLTLCGYLSFGTAFRDGALDGFARAVLPPAVTRGARSGRPVRAGPDWRPYSPAAFDAALKSGRPVLIDFSADWCAICLEMEESTFADGRVLAEMSRFSLLRVDGSDSSSPAVGDAESRFGIAGYPTTILYGSDGREAARLVGFVPAEKFLKSARGVR